MTEFTGNVILTPEHGEQEIFDCSTIPLDCEHTAAAFFVGVATGMGLGKLAKVSMCVDTRSGVLPQWFHYHQGKLYAEILDEVGTTDAFDEAHALGLEIGTEMAEAGEEEEA